MWFATWFVVFSFPSLHISDGCEDVRRHQIDSISREGWAPDPRADLTFSFLTVLMSASFVCLFASLIGCFSSGARLQFLLACSSVLFRRFSTWTTPAMRLPSRALHVSFGPCALLWDSCPPSSCRCARLRHTTHTKLLFRRPLLSPPNRLLCMT